MHPKQAGKITGMLLEMDNSEILAILDSHTTLELKVFEAMTVLRAHQARVTTNELSAATPQQQKQLLGEDLFHSISLTHPEQAGKITGMLLEMDNSEILHMLDSYKSLVLKVDEAIMVLRDHQEKQQLHQQAIEVVP